MSSSTAQADLVALRDLLASPGWRLVAEMIDRHVLDAAVALADPLLCQHNDSLHFRRGAMWAASQLKSAIAHHVNNLEGQAAFEAAQAKGARK